MNKPVIDSKFERDAPITPQIYRILRDRIIKNDLPPGSPLSEPEFAKQYDISRQPVREAFIKLANEGLLIIRPQRRTLVTKIDYPTVLQTRFVREAVEADIVALLANRDDPALTTELRQQLKIQRKIAKSSPFEFIHEDMRFHRTLAQAADKDEAWKFIEGLNSQMDRVRFLSLSHFPADQLVQEHSLVVDQIERQDVAAASAVMRKHLQRMIGDLPKIVQENGNFFDRFDPEPGES